MRTVAVLFLALSAALAACSGDKAPPEDRLRTSEPTVAVTARAASLDGSSGEFVSALSTAARNAKDVESFRGEMNWKMNFGGVPFEFGGELLYRAPDASYLQMDVFNQEIEVLAYAERTYIRVPGEDWMTFDLAEFGVNTGQLEQLSENRGFFDLETVANTLGELRQVQDEEIDGVAYNHYQGEADFDDLLDQAPGLLDPSLEAQVSGLVDQVAFDFWLDPQTDLPRRIEMMMEMDVPGGEQGRMTISFDYLEFNKPVDIPAEPAGAQPFDPASFAR